MKRIIVLISMLSLVFCFRAGTMTLGGSAGMTMDLDNNSKILWIEPSLGYFMNQNILIEGGINWNKFIHDDYEVDPEFNFTIGARYFLNNSTYLGYQYENLGEFADYSRVSIKGGFLSPITSNVYIDSIIRWSWFTVEDDAGYISCSFGLAYFI